MWGKWKIKDQLDQGGDQDKTIGQIDTVTQNNFFEDKIYRTQYSKENDDSNSAEYSTVIESSDCHQAYIVAAKFYL